jgi:sugar lactone lactonase YvrE
MLDMPGKTFHFLALVCAGLLSLPVHAEEPGKTEARAAARRLYEESVAAYKVADYPRFLALTKDALRLRPDSPSLLHNLACGEALTGHPKESSEAALRLVSRGIDTGLLEEADLASVRDRPEFAPVRKGLAELAQPVGSPAEAFRLKEKGLLTEGIAFDPKTKTFFVSSVHRRKIVARSASGVVEDFLPAGSDVLGVFALRCDPARRLLWATSGAVREMQGFTKTLDGKSELLKIDLDAKKVLGRFALEDGRPHNLNDLTVDSRGTVYVSDALGGGLYRLAAADKRLQPLVPAGRLASPQGLALSPDEKRLYVAEYGAGLSVVDPRSGNVREVSAKEDAPLFGIDGLVPYGRHLVAIQNGIRPHRVVRLTLDATGQRVERADTLARNDSRFQEPTLGVVVDSALCFIANSQWGSFEKDGTPFPPEKLAEPLILRVSLGEAR